ncbi:hypothetical protein DPEC_G00115980 [Dallia pectoralis]|uniref:Uncharacterized protein n=1 Tax=Dallia pectoralis TaxID=75939 RepID=A0ACC2GU30_DALPE|nr:hypothetical protein DPEC_G00115980 [Dallia pectoralis]
MLVWATASCSVFNHAQDHIRSLRTQGSDDEIRGKTPGNKQQNAVKSLEFMFVTSLLHCDLQASGNTPSIHNRAMLRCRHISTSPGCSSPQTTHGWDLLPCPPFPRVSFPTTHCLPWEELAETPVSELPRSCVYIPRTHAKASET